MDYLFEKRKVSGWRGGGGGRGEEKKRSDGKKNETKVHSENQTNKKETVLEHVRKEKSFV